MKWPLMRIPNFNTTHIINGDATGKRNDTRSPMSDYDIIKKYLSNYRQPGNKKQSCLKRKSQCPTLQLELDTTWLTLNLLMSWGRQGSMFTKIALLWTRGLRLTKLKPGAQYLEDDSKAHQHVNNSFGLWYRKNAKRRERSWNLSRRRRIKGHS